MYEPHLVDLANQHSHGDHEGMSLLEELDKIAPIKSFDAFPKVRLFFLSLSLFKLSRKPRLMQGGVGRVDVYDKIEKRWGPHSSRWTDHIPTCPGESSRGQPRPNAVAEILPSLSAPLVRMIWASTYMAHRIMRFKWIQMSKRIFS